MRILAAWVMLVMAVNPLAAAGTAWSDCGSGPAPMQMPSGHAHDAHHAHHGETGGAEHSMPPAGHDGACSECAEHCDCQTACSVTAAAGLAGGAVGLTGDSPRPGPESFHAGPAPQVLFRPPIRL